MIPSFDNCFHLILFGIPGAGKGSASFELSKKYKNVYHLAPGNIFREHKLKNTPFYKNKISTYIDGGFLVPSEITNEMMGKVIKKIPHQSVIIYDGYPRTISQMEYLEKLIKRTSKKTIPPFVNLIINILIDKAIAKKRIVNRRICSNCGATYNLANAKNLSKCLKCSISPLVLLRRKDDTPEIYEKRYKWSINKVKPVIDLYKSMERVDFVDISTDESTTIQEIVKIIENILIERKVKIEVYE